MWCHWWAQMDSNHRPHAYQACALTTWAMRPFLFSSNLAQAYQSVHRSELQPPELCALSHISYRNVVVEIKGIEPLTPCLQSRCSPSWAKPPCFKLPQNWTILNVFELSWLARFFLRKEVIQPHLPIRLPCYDLTPIIEPAFGCVPLAVRQQTSGIPNSHGLTGGVYKARERIHRSMLIYDY